MNESDPNHLHGYCECGCGEKTTVARHTNAKRKSIAGQPLRFIRGHSNRARRKNPDPYTVDPATGCWEWQWTRAPAGYGMVKDPKAGEKRQAHRVYYELHVGPIPEGYQIDHLCRNRGCVNPDHLEAVTPGENCRRGLKTKLSWDIVREIRASEKGAGELAEKFGVGRRTIWQIRTNQTWVER